jgi:hypothetical protein
MDMDLAQLYGVETKNLKRAVRRNIDRFPEDFMFELRSDEFADLRCQFGTSGWESTRYVPMAFKLNRELLCFRVFLIADKPLQ